MFEKINIEAFDGKKKNPTICSVIVNEIINSFNNQWGDGVHNLELLLSMLVQGLCQQLKLLDKVLTGI